MAEAPSTRAKGKRKLEETEAIPSIEGLASNASSRPSTSAESQAFGFSQQVNSHPASEDASSQRTTRSKRRKLNEKSESDSPSNNASSQETIEDVSAQASRAASERPGMKTRSNGSRATNRSISSSENLPVTPPEEVPAISETTETPAPADTPPDLNGDELDPDILPMRRGRPPNRGRGRGRGGRGGRGGLNRVNSSAKIKKTATGRGRGGRGGRGKKISSIHQVQAAYDRQRQLRQSFKGLSKAMKDGLEALAERDLQSVDDDPDFHKKQPEYQKTINSLKTIHEGVQRKIDRKFNFEMKKVQNTKNMGDAYINAKFASKIKELQDQFMTKLQEESLIIVKQARGFEDVELAEDGQSVIPKSSHARYHRFLDDDENTKPRSQTVESHIRDSLLPKDVIGDTVSPRKPRTKPSLAGDSIVRRRGLLSVANITDIPDGEVEDGDATGDDRDEAQPDASPAPRGDNQLDEFGAYLPSKRKVGRANAPNNRVQVKETFSFDDGEIGLRCLTAEGLEPVLKNAGVTIPRHQYPRPPTDGHVYYDNPIPDIHGDQSNSQASNSEDFEKDIILRHGLHPKYGLASGAIKQYGDNCPDVPDELVSYNVKLAPGGWNGHTDFNEPLPRMEPKVFFNSTGDKVSYMGRSVRAVNVEADFEALMPKLKMEAVLRELGEYAPHTSDEDQSAASVDAVRAKEQVDTILDAAEALDVNPSILSSTNEKKKRKGTDSELKEDTVTASKKSSKKSTKTSSDSATNKLDDAETVANEPTNEGPSGLDVLAGAAISHGIVQQPDQQPIRKAAPPPKTIEQPPLQAAPAPLPPPPPPPPPMHPPQGGQRPGPYHRDLYQSPPKSIPTVLPNMGNAQIQSAHAMPQAIQPQPTYSHNRALSGGGPAHNMLPPPPLIMTQDRAPPMHMGPYQHQAMSSQHFGPSAHGPQPLGPPIGYQQMGLPQYMGSPPSHYPSHHQLSEGPRYYQNPPDHHMQAQIQPHQHQHIHPQPPAPARGRGGGGGMRELLPRPDPAAQRLNRGYTGPGGVNVTSPQGPINSSMHYPSPYGAQSGYQGPYQIAPNPNQHHPQHHQHPQHQVMQPGQIQSQFLGSPHSQQHGP